MKARGTINQVKGDHTGNSVNVILLLLLLFLDLILYSVLGPNPFHGFKVRDFGRDKVGS